MGIFFNIPLHREHLEGMSPLLNERRSCKNPPGGSPLTLQPQSWHQTNSSDVAYTTRSRILTIGGSLSEVEESAVGATEKMFLWSFYEPIYSKLLIRVYLSSLHFNPTHKCETSPFK